MHGSVLDYVKKLKSEEVRHRLPSLTIRSDAEQHQNVDDNDALHKNRFVSEENNVDEPPYGREQNVVEKHQRHQQQKTKKGVPLIDSLRKSKKKCDKTDGRANGGVVPPWKQKMRAKGSPPTKKVSWEASAAADNIDTHKDSKDSYDYIDANECHDGGHATAFYSITDNEATHSRYPLHLSPPSRYDYLDFYKPKQHQQQQQRVARRIADEPLYATASQIYSMGSEDPYSSIVSIGGGGGGGSSSAYYERYGAYYYRINRNGTANRMAQTSTATLDNNKCSELDALYAKIDRKASLAEPTQLGTSSAAAHCQLEKQPHQQQPECESGSGSVGSSQPSYRYLTVREDVGVIRERIRLREQANLERRLEQERDDAYYSTIGNEYETVGEGGSSTNGGGAAVPLPQHPARTGVPSEESNHHLSINFDYSAEPTASSLTTTTPLPPTSPIPRLQPQQQQQQQPPPLTSPPEVPMPPPFMRRPVVVMPPNSSSAVNGAVMTNGKCCGERTSAPSLTTNSGTSPKKSTAMRRSFFNGSSPLNFFNSHSSNKPPPPTSPPPKATPEHNKDNNTRFSRIPIFNRKNAVTIRSRTPSPPATTTPTMMMVVAHCADVATQTAQKCQQQPHVLSFRSNDKTAPRDSSRSPLPPQVGQDYVSTIELSKKYGGGGGGDQRGWPLNSAAASCLDRK
uniref:Uncharacterized protein n=1 Tax=Globodera rostochiensis TaxID=31243 RepID=A0A914HPX0_GLORO